MNAHPPVGRVVVPLVALLLACGGGSSSSGGGSSSSSSSSSSGGGSSSSSSSSSSGGPTATGPTFVPASGWTCGMPEGIPNPTDGSLVFRATLQLGDTQDLGTTQYGARRVLDITGGTLTGLVEGTVLAGGLDFELTLSNGVVEQEQLALLRASDGTKLYMRTCGVAPAGASAIRFVPDFEAPTGSTLKWLNTGTYAGIRTIDAVHKTMELAVYDVSGISTAVDRVPIAKPAGVPGQPWECSTHTGSQGDVLYTESVTLGTAFTVGTSKRGYRNVAPITGGTLSNGLTGTVVPGGADYQLTPPGGSMILDARYVLALEDGEFVIVRNCGTWSALVPTFEARVGGLHESLDTGPFVSSPPTVKNNGASVDITIYERG